MIKLTGSTTRPRERKNQASPATKPSKPTAAAHSNLLLKNVPVEVMVGSPAARAGDAAGCAWSTVRVGVAAGSTVFDVMGGVLVVEAVPCSLAGCLLTGGSGE